MKVGDLIKDNFYQRIGIIIEEGGTNIRVFLVRFLPDGRNFKSREKWLGSNAMKKIS